MEQHEEDQSLAAEPVTLDSEIKQFVEGLPYWTQYLARILLDGIIIKDANIEEAYEFFLQEHGLLEETEKPDLEFSYEGLSYKNYFENVRLQRLANVVGVNALREGEVIDFHPQLTIIYGANGSGKSGYTRLLKRAFYSRHTEKILPNVRSEEEVKEINAEFTFNDSGTPKKFGLSDSSHPVFDQFAVFDEKCASVHLTERNQFEFRPAGLAFFNDLTEAVNRVEARISNEVRGKSSTEDFTQIFDGESTIQAEIVKLSPAYDVENLKAFLPISDEDIASKTKLEKEHDALFIASKTSATTIASLQELIGSITKNQASFENFNKPFSQEGIGKCNGLIEQYKANYALAMQEDVSKLSMDDIKHIGSSEWRNFMIAAYDLAAMQSIPEEGEEQLEEVADGDSIYPHEGDNCLLCHQPLSPDAVNLIHQCWRLLKSQAASNLAATEQRLAEVIAYHQKIDFDLFPEGNLLGDWLRKHEAEYIEAIESQLNEQSTLRDAILTGLESKTTIPEQPIQTSTSKHDAIAEALNGKIAELQSGNTEASLKALQGKINYYVHQGKLADNVARIEAYIDNKKWIAGVRGFNFSTFKRRITENEKRLSDQFYNAGYLQRFNEECESMNIDAGINIEARSADGKSNRKLYINGKNPAEILSESEQKVAALADFLAEMDLSDINEGMIFDDPVTSLDEYRRINIAKRLARASRDKQVVIFSHDLVFVAALMDECQEQGVGHSCHWIENIEGTPGKISLNNTPSYEKQYKNDTIPQGYLNKAKKEGPEERERLIGNGFTALRTCYEALVIWNLFNGVVQRFAERVSVDSLDKVKYTPELRDQLMDGFKHCCKYMEGHTHSDRYRSTKQSSDGLQEEINRYNSIRNALR